MRNTAELIVLKKSLNILGFDHTNGKRGIEIPIYVISIILVLSNTICLVVYKWEDVGENVKRIRAIVFYTTLFGYILVYVFKWDDLILVLRIIEERWFPIPYKNSEERTKLMKSMDHDILKIDLFFKNGILTFLIAGIVVPILINLISIFKQGMNEVSVSNFALPYPFYYPENHETMTVYVIACVVQSRFHIGGTISAYYVTSSVLIALSVIEGELVLLRRSIEEMGKGVLTQQTILDVKDSECQELLHSNEAQQELKTFITYVVKHYEHIFRKVKEVTKGIQLTSLIANSCASIYACMSIYIIVQSDDIILKIQEAMPCILWSYGKYYHDRIGENIATENENLRQALYGLSWIDKPQWFKKSLQIILTHSTKTMEIKPVGLFVLNLKNFALFGNAAYSYYNVINNM